MTHNRRTVIHAAPFITQATVAMRIAADWKTTIQRAATAFSENGKRSADVAKRMSLRFGSCVEWA